MSWVVFVPTDPPGQQLVVGLDEAGAKLTTGATWNAVIRPRRTAISEFGGFPLDSLAIAVVFDGFRDDVSQEPGIGLLYSYVKNMGSNAEPTILQIGGVVPLSGQKRWVITSIDEGDVIRRQGDGARLRARFTVNVLEYVPPALAVAAPPPPAAAAVQRNAAGGGSGGGATYTVKRGDTLSGIAQKVLGNSSRWPEIASLNGIRDPRKLGVGQVLRLP